MSIQTLKSSKPTWDESEDKLLLNEGEVPSLIVQYETLVNQQHLHIKAIHDIINYTIVIIGLPIPLIGAFISATSGQIPADYLVYFLLVPSFLCLFMQINFLKHYHYIGLIAHFISTGLGIQVNKKNWTHLLRYPLRYEVENGIMKAMIFNGFDDYLTETVSSGRANKLMSMFFGISDGLFALAAGAFYWLCSLVAFIMYYSNLVYPNNFIQVILLILLFLFYIFVLVTSYLVRRMMISQRKQEIIKGNSVAKLGLYLSFSENKKNRD